MTIREWLRQLNQIAIEHETELDELLNIDFDSQEDGYFRLTGVEIVRSLGTGKFTVSVIEV